MRGDMAQVVFPDGRTAWLDRKLANSKYCMDMGGRVLEPLPVVPEPDPMPIIDDEVQPTKPRRRRKPQAASAEADQTTETHGN